MTFPPYWLLNSAAFSSSGSCTHPSSFFLLSSWLPLQLPFQKVTKVLSPPVSVPQTSLISLTVFSLKRGINLQCPSHLSRSLACRWRLSLSLFAPLGHWSSGMVVCPAPCQATWRKGHLALTPGSFCSILVHLCFLNGAGPHIWISLCPILWPTVQ